MPTLTSSSTFTVADRSTAVAEQDFTVYPSVGFPGGSGRIVHPVLGAYDYEQKPLQWVNLDAAGVIVAPVWAATKTLGGAAASLWQGKLEDVIVEERWTGAGGLALPIAQLRMLIAIFTNPIDPAAGYVQWFPNYATAKGYNVIPVDLQVGQVGSSSLAKLTGVSRLSVVLDDAVNYGDGWVRVPVTFYLKVVSEL